MKKEWKKPTLLPMPKLPKETVFSSNSCGDWKPGDGKPPWSGGPGGNPCRPFMTRVIEMFFGKRPHSV